jgi:hypothetical protein
MGFIKKQKNTIRKNYYYIRITYKYDIDHIVQDLLSDK